MDHLLASMGSWRLSEWMAYYRLEPFGSKRDEIHAALIASVIANVNRDKDKKPFPYTIEDFLINFDEEEDLPNEYLLAKLQDVGFFKDAKLDE